MRKGKWRRWERRWWQPTLLKIIIQQWIIIITWWRPSSRRKLLGLPHTLRIEMVRILSCFSQVSSPSLFVCLFVSWCSLTYLVFFLLYQPLLLLVIVVRHPTLISQLSEIIGSKPNGFKMQDNHRLMKKRIFHKIWGSLESGNHWQSRKSWDSVRKSKMWRLSLTGDWWQEKERFLDRLQSNMFI